MDLVYFILFVSILIFIHEFGHFAFAKLFGVKVIAFSIGFGPRIIKIRGKETEYYLSLLPFGGFVKMLEESKTEEPILPEDKHRTFESLPIAKRAIVVLAGPAMNLLFPIALYTSVYLEDTEFLPAVVGSVTPGKPADQKLFEGDVIKSIDGIEVRNFPEVQELIAARVGKTVTVRVEREGTSTEVAVASEDEVELLEPRELELVEHVGRIGISPMFTAAVIGVPKTDSPAWRAGLRTFDRITMMNGQKVDSTYDLIKRLSQNNGENIVIAYLRPIPVTQGLGGLGGLGGLCDFATFETGMATLTPLARPEGTRAQGPDTRLRAADAFARTGIEGAELYVAFVPEGSSEYKMGLRPGDRLTHLDGIELRSWKVERRSGSVLGDASLVGRLLETPSRSHELAWTREGQRLRGTFQLQKEQWTDEVGRPVERYVFRSTHWTPKVSPGLVPNPHPIAYALRRGLVETMNAIRFVGYGFLRLLERRISLSNVSGAITLYDIAGEAGAKGPTYFVWAMALTSVNLGLINLLPIPVLDGGHLMLLAIELVRRRPVSVRARSIASLAGMTILIALMLLAFKNDLTRKWHEASLTEQIRALGRR